MIRWEDIETSSVVVGALLFVGIERAWPGRRAVDRRKDLARDLLALLVLVIGVNLSRALLFASGHAARLESPLKAFPSAARVAICIVLLDLALYCIHRAMHASDLLWRTHRWHHSSEDLYWFSGLRTSLLHAFLYAIPQVLLPFFLFGLSGWEIGAIAILGTASQLYIHSSVDFGLGPLSWLIVTPRYHRLHHSRSDLQSKNLSTFLTLWDRTFGTFVDPNKVPPPASLGVDEKIPVARMIVGV